MSHSAESTPPAKRRRLVNCCEACRIRHLKCDLRPSSCRQCEMLGIECIRNVNVRFRHLSQTGDFQDQVWLNPTTDVSFHDETNEIAQFYEGDLPGNEREVSNLAATKGSDVNFWESRTSGISSVQAPLDSPRSASGTMPPPQMSPQSVKPSPLMYESPNSLDSFPSLGRASPAATHPTVLPFTPREAELIRHYSENMALWADTTDLQRHFELEVPRRALSNRILRYAIFTFASRHMNRHADGDWAEALEYHNKCLELLIPIMSSNEFTEEIFAAVTILRLFEEIDTKDNRFHLLGATRILNTLPSLSSSGGLGEAAAWLCLRQDVYISLVHQQPLRSHLENFDKSAAFTMPNPNDPAWTNRIIFYVAKVLSIAFLDRTVENLEALRRIGDEIERWNNDKPHTFEPIKFIQRGREPDRRLPVIWMLSPFHVLALQYYHIAKILLVVSTYGDRMLGYEQFQHGRRIEKHVRNHLLIILGLAASNRRAENTLFEARHTLSVWGGVLRHRLDQDAAKQFLMDMEKKTAFPISSTLKALEEQWEEDSDRG